MKLTVRQPIAKNDGTFELRNVAVTDIVVNGYALMAIDGSTSNSGVAIMRQHDCAILYIISAERDKKNESPVRYKIELKRAIKDILARNRFIDQIYYEEPVIANLSAVSNLFMLRAFIEEMIIENEPDFDYLQHYEVPNMRWKKLFLEPEKVPQGTDKQKEAVRNKLITYLPFLSVITQDEVDALCMGFVCCQTLAKGGSGKDIQAKKKAHKFKYNVRFIGADDDDSMFVELWDIYDGPESILQNGIRLTELDAKGKFDEHVFETMGDDDALIIVKFSSKRHSNLVLEHRIGNLSAIYDYIYAVVWRVARKRN